MAWTEIVQQKQRLAADALPQVYRLPEEVPALLRYPLETNQNRIIDQQVARQSALLSKKELAITEDYTTNQLLDKLASGALSSVEVTTAFCKRSAIAKQLLNCVTEVFYEDALTRAKLLDKHLALTGRPVGPLHGLPISLKDSFKVKGYDATIGFTALIGKPTTINSALVDMLLQLGAVLYVKTNVPQTMMTADSHNNIWGRTLNPHNTTLTAGGSTGGEGSLLAFRGSPLGIGTDVAGSVRIPSLCCGIYGFKPTTNRFPSTGQQEPLKLEYPAIMPVIGPMSTSLEALHTLCEGVLTNKPDFYDSTALPIPWVKLPTLPSSTKLNIGVLLEDPLLPLHSPVKRVMTEVAGTLTRAGHNMIPISPECSRVAELAELAMHFFSLSAADAGCFLKDSGEPPVPSVANPPPFIRTEALQSLREVLEGMDTFGKLATLESVRNEIRESWRLLWNQKLDVVIAPGAQHTAVRHDTYAFPAYTVFLNLLDYPACIIPHGRASKELDPEAQIYADGTKYVPDEVDKAPTAIQVFAPTMRDEACLQFARLIDTLLNAQEARNNEVH